MSMDQTALDFLDEISEEIQELLLTLPKDKWIDGTHIYQYKGIWWRPEFLSGMIYSQKHFQAQDSDIIVTSFPKSGTTWLKALTYAIVHRHKYAFDQSPLLTTNPHLLVPFFDMECHINKNNVPNFLHLSTPRIFGTHMPYSFLPGSIVDSNCRIVYICRNPLDQFISHWFFLSKMAKDRNMEPLPLEEAFDRVCNGIQPFGPYSEHILGYWKSSLNNSQKMLFLKYEDLKKDTLFYVEKLARFLGCPFTDIEKAQGVVGEIVRLCSMETMKNSKAKSIMITKEFHIANQHFY